MLILPCISDGGVTSLTVATQIYLPSNGHSEKSSFLVIAIAAAQINHHCVATKYQSTQTIFTFDTDYNNA